MAGPHLHFFVMSVVSCPVVCVYLCAQPLLIYSLSWSSIHFSHPVLTPPGLSVCLSLYYAWGILWFLRILSIRSCFSFSSSRCAHSQYRSTLHIFAMSLSQRCYVFLSLHLSYLFAFPRLSLAFSCLPIPFIRLLCSPLFLPICTIVTPHQSDPAALCVSRCRLSFSSHPSQVFPFVPHIMNMLRCNTVRPTIDKTTPPCLLRNTQKVGIMFHY